MREILPGNPTEAGPESRNEPEPDVKDLMRDVEEELCFARRNFGIRTVEDMRKLAEAIESAQEKLQSALYMVCTMGVPHGPR